MKTLQAFLILILVTGCSSTGHRHPASRPSGAEEVTVSLIHINDVYEISASSRGTQGGLARVATLAKKLRQENPNTLFLIAGDFLSPSAIGTAKVNGEALAGQQMIDVFNAIPLDYATFGNHEFDLKAGQLAKRLKESRFKWISSNVRETGGEAYAGVPENTIHEFTGQNGVKARIGIFGITIDSNQRGWVKYLDPIETAKSQVALLKSEKVDAILALTHLSIEEDKRLAREVPGIDLILGGHEHEHSYHREGVHSVPIAKADENAKSVYVHKLLIHPSPPNMSNAPDAPHTSHTPNPNAPDVPEAPHNTHTVSVESTLQAMDSSVPEDESVKERVDEWTQKAFDAFRKDGFQPEQTVARTTIALDGREAVVRAQGNDLTKLITLSMVNVIPKAELAIFNGGSIRIDDVLPPGEVTQYDILRILPFGGKLFGVDLSGKALKAIFEINASLKGSGEYVHFHGVETRKQKWFIGGKALEQDRSYRVALNEYLLSGQAKAMSGIKLEEFPKESVFVGPDARTALIHEMKRPLLVETRTESYVY